MIIMGIDPGYDRMGYGFIQSDKGKQTLLSYGCLTTNRADSDQQRLYELYGKLQNLIAEFNPDEIAMESLFFSSNAKTAIIVGQARGAILLCCEQANKVVAAYAPLEVKLAITGYGKAEKVQIQQMIKSILHLNAIPKPDDAADALAIALTHCYSNKLKQKHKSV